MQKDFNEIITKVVSLGNLIRKYKSDGQLTMVAPPTIYGYLSFLRMSISMPEMPLQDVALATLLGNSCNEEKKHITSILNQVFGINLKEDHSTGLGGNLF